MFKDKQEKKHYVNVPPADKTKAKEAIMDAFETVEVRCFHALACFPSVTHEYNRRIEARALKTWCDENTVRSPQRLSFNETFCLKQRERVETAC